MAIKKTEELKSKKTLKSVKIKRSYKPILKAKDIPATQGMLDQLHKVIRADMKSLEKKMDARFSRVDARFSQVDARFSQVDARFNQVDARFNQVDARLSQVESGIQLVLSEVHRVALMMEEQNKRNIFVLEGYDQLYKRMDRLESNVEDRMTSMESVVFRKPGQI